MSSDKERKLRKKHRRRELILGGKSMSEFKERCGNALVGGSTGAAMGGSIGAAVGGLGAPVTASIGASLGGAIGSVTGFFWN